MFNPFKQEDPALEAAIASVFKDMETMNADDDDYDKMRKQLSELYALKPKGVDPNTLLTVLGNIAIGLSVLKYEQTGVITTRIRDFLVKK